MSDTTIQWTDKTWNPLDGCTPVSAGCQNCYAAGVAMRFPKTYPGLAEMRGQLGQRRAVFTGKVLMHEDHRLTAPLHWKKPRRVFVNSMSDLFHEDVPFAFVDKVFAIMALCPQHTFQVLTKRPERMAEYFAASMDDDGRRPSLRIGLEALAFTLDEHTKNKRSHVGAGVVLEGIGCGRSGKLKDWPLPNVWLGTSVEDQAAADVRIPYLLRCAARVRFLSCEPLLGPVDLTAHALRAQRALQPNGLPDILVEVPVHWVIVGGESGKHARPCDVAWIRSLVDQCREANVAVFVKQAGRMIGYQGEQVLPGFDAKYQSQEERWPGWTFYGLKDGHGGDMDEWPDDLRVREFPA